MNEIKITPELLAKLKEVAQKANNFESSCGLVVAVEYMNTCTPALILSLISSYEKLEKDLDAECYSEAYESGRAVWLEREADWLAYMLANGDDCVRDACNDSSPCKMPDHELPYKEEYVQKYCKPCWRNAARKAIDDTDNAMEAEQEARER